MLLQQILQCFFSVSSCILAPYRPKNTFVRQPTAVTPDFSISHRSKKRRKGDENEYFLQIRNFGGTKFAPQGIPPPFPKAMSRTKILENKSPFFSIVPSFSPFSGSSNILPPSIPKIWKISHIMQISPFFAHSPSFFLLLLPFFSKSGVWVTSQSLLIQNYS